MAAPQVLPNHWECTPLLGLFAFNPTPPSPGFDLRLQKQGCQTPAPAWSAHRSVSQSDCVWGPSLSAVLAKPTLFFLPLPAVSQIEGKAPASFLFINHKMGRAGITATQASTMNFFVLLPALHRRGSQDEPSQKCHTHYRISNFLSSAAYPGLLS